MEIEEIEKRAMHGLPLERREDIGDVMCYMSLRSLYNDYRHNGLDREQAQKDKRVIYTAYANYCKQREQMDDLIRLYQDRIKRSENRLAKFVHGITDGTDVQTLYVMAVKLIGDLVGNNVLIDMVRTDDRENAV